MTDLVECGAQGEIRNAIERHIVMFDFPSFMIGDHINLIFSFRQDL